MIEYKGAKRLWYGGSLTGWILWGYIDGKYALKWYPNPAYTGPEFPLRKQIFGL